MTQEPKLLYHLHKWVSGLQQKHYSTLWRRPIWNLNRIHWRNIAG